MKESGFLNLLFNPRTRRFFSKSIRTLKKNEDKTNFPTQPLWQYGTDHSQKR